MLHTSIMLLNRSTLMLLIMFSWLLLQLQFDNIDLMLQCTHKPWCINCKCCICWMLYTELAIWRGLLLKHICYLSKWLSVLSVVWSLYCIILCHVYSIVKSTKHLPGWLEKSGVLFRNNFRNDVYIVCRLKRYWVNCSRCCLHRLT